MKEYKSFYKTVAGNEGTKCKYPNPDDCCNLRKVKS